MRHNTTTRTTRRTRPRPTGWNVPDGDLYDLAYGPTNDAELLALVRGAVRLA